MTHPWADLKDRIVANYPGAGVSIQGDGLNVDYMGVVAAVSRSGGGIVTLVATIKDGVVQEEKTTRTHDDVADAYAAVADALGAAWRAAQRPRTSPGGSSNYGGGDCDAVSGDYYEVADDDGDGGDE